MSTEDRLILLSIAAEELGYSTERLRQFIKKGKVTGARRGKLWFLYESEIEFLRETTRGGYKHDRRAPSSARERAPLYEPRSERLMRVAERQSPYNT